MPASLGCELSIVMDGGAAARTQALVSAKPPTRSVFGERIFAHDGFAG